MVRITGEESLVKFAKDLGVPSEALKGSLGPLAPLLKHYRLESYEKVVADNKVTVEEVLSAMDDKVSFRTQTSTC